MLRDPVVSPYPEFELWKDKIPDESRLRIINAGDFPKEQILQGLGIEKHRLVGSFGITDEDEIRQRQALMRFLHEQPRLVRWATARGVKFELPTGGKEFLAFNDPILPHSPYWQEVYAFINAIDGVRDVPDRLRQMADTLRQGLSLESEERQMAAAISERLQAVTLLEGIATYTVVKSYEPVDQKKPEGDKHWVVSGLSFAQGVVYGHRLYTQSLSEVRHVHYPDWTLNRWHPANWIRLGRLVRRHVDRQNRDREQAALNGMVVSNFDESIRASLSRWLLKALSVLKGDLLMQLRQATVNFRYTKEGLEVEIIRIAAEQLSSSSGSSVISDFRGFTRAQRLQIAEMWQTYTQCVQSIRTSVVDSKLVRDISTAHPGFFNRQIKVDAREMDREFRYFAIINLYQSPEFVELFRRIRAHRDFFAHHYYRLGDVAALLQQLMATAAEYNAPLCFPEVNAEGHSVGFDRLLPVQLLFRLGRGEVVPVEGLPELNGQMIGLTGAHGGGKTETVLTIPTNIWLAQSGLPVFAANFHFNVKRVLGLVFDPSRGVGSKSEQLLDRMVTLLRQIDGIDGREVVVVMDEVGVGTQEDDGFELGRDFLADLAKRGISVIFNTPILRVAEYCKNQLGGTCFRFDRQHRIQPGIAGGGMRELRREKGLDKLLAH